MGKKLITLFFLVYAVTSSSVQAGDNLNIQIENLVEQLTTSMSGEVVKGTEAEVYISVGQQDGIMPGTIFEIIRQGESLKVGDEIIGYEETPVATVEVNKAREKLSICKVVESHMLPQAGDKAFQLKKQVKRILVGQFVYNQEFNTLTKSLQEKLANSLTNMGMQVVERDQLERVLKEQKMGYSGLINSTTAKKIGELFGAEGMILGTVSDFGNDIVINGRLVDVETGNAISASEVELAKTPMIAGMLTVKVEEPPVFSIKKNQKEQHSKQKSRKDSTINQKLAIDGYDITLKKCMNQSGYVTCNLLITNREDDREFILYSKKSRLFDLEGNVSVAKKVQCANKQGRDIRSRLIKDIPVKASITFPTVSSDAHGAALIEIASYRYNIQFRNVQFEK